MISTLLNVKAKQDLSNRAAANIIENLREIEPYCETILTD